MKNKNEIFLNQPIDKDSYDAISIGAYVKQLKNAIDSGAKSVAVTSNFGTGKSSLIRLLEDEFCDLNTKFCYVNMWSHLSSECDNLELHKAFLYQFANQISTKKGQYVSKRLNENYGLFNIRANSFSKQIWLIISIFFIVIGFAFTKFYNNLLSLIIDNKFFNEHNFEIGSVSFIIAAIIILCIIFTTDVVFSSNKSDGQKRKVDENEIMDIYNSYILKRNFCAKKYIVVIEDLDRTENYDAIMQFLKELKKYYMPKKSNVTFIVNIKPEGVINKERQQKFIKNESKTFVNYTENSERKVTEESVSEKLEINEVFPKVFDFILDLKTINYDNYDKILIRLLKEKEEYINDLGLNIWKDDSKNELISDFEWIILSRNQSIGIREIKERLNYSLSTFAALKNKFPNSEISFKKCVVASYLQSAFSYEYYLMIDKGINEVLDLYAKDKSVLPELFKTQLNELFNSNDVSLNFAEDLLRILKNKGLEEDYRNYYYNIPKDSDIYTADELRFINTVMYGKDLSFIFEESWSELSDLVNSVTKINPALLKQTIQRLDRLSLDYPLCIVLNPDLLEVALKTTPEKVWDVFKKLDYKDDFLRTKSYIFRILTYNKKYNNSMFKSKVLSNLIFASQKDIIAFRSEIRETKLIPYADYKMLYFEDFPLLTVGEIKAARDVLQSLSLIDYISKELNYDTFCEINDVLSKTSIYNDVDNRNIMINFYMQVSEEFKKNNEPSVDVQIMNYMLANNVFIDELFEIISVESSEEELYKCFINLVNKYGDLYSTLPSYIIDIIVDNQTEEGLNKSVCNILLNNKEYNLYIKNMIDQDSILEIDYTNDGVRNTINEYDEEFIRKHLNLFRQGVINSDIEDFSSYDLFLSKYPIISKKLLFMIRLTQKALKIMPVVLLDDDNCEYICQYFNRKGSNRQESYLILKYIASIKNLNLKKTVFEKIDFTRVHYNMISQERKDEIINLVKDVYDFTKSTGMLQFMSITKVSNENFEDYIFNINDKKQVAPIYAEYVKKLLVINNKVIQNLLNLPYYYGFNSSILREFYKRGHYKYYVVSKTMYDKRFTFEIDKIESLKNVYLEIFTSKANFVNIIENMSKTELVDYFIQEKMYETISDEDVMIRFANSRKQSKFVLNYILENFSKEFVAMYYSSMKGFDSYDSAKEFVNIMELNYWLARRENVYNNCHEKLVNGELKFKYTITKRRANKSDLK